VKLHTRYPTIGHHIQDFIMLKVRFPLTAALLVVSQSLHFTLANICNDKYDEVKAPLAELSCKPFPGDPTIHGLVYGCTTANQDEEAPSNVVSKSFTEICQGEASDGAQFTCYRFANDTDFSEFITAAAAIADTPCAVGELESPIFQYQETTADYDFGGESGGQETTGQASVDFQQELTAGAFYVVTTREGEPLQTNSPDASAAETDAPISSGNETDAPGAEVGAPSDETTSTETDETTSTGANETTSTGTDEPSSSAFGISLHHAYAGQTLVVVTCLLGSCFQMPW